MHVLYVEDDDLRYRAIARYLRFEGIEMITRAANLERALLTLGNPGAQFALPSISFVLTDWSFPVGDSDLAAAGAGKLVVRRAIERGTPYAVISGSECPPDYEGLWIDKADRGQLDQLVALIRKS